jgi:hypothetical protein
MNRLRRSLDLAGAWSFSEGTAISRMRMRWDSATAQEYRSQTMNQTVSMSRTLEDMAYWE